MAFLIVSKLSNAQRTSRVAGQVKVDLSMKVTRTDEQQDNSNLQRMMSVHLVSTKASRIKTVRIERVRDQKEKKSF
jgi:hypothetical protein